MTTSIASPTSRPAAAASPACAARLARGRSRSSTSPNTCTRVWTRSQDPCPRRFRRGTLRHATEMAHRDAWLARVREAAPKNYDLAVELIACRRLVKGYSDTHSRGRSKFDRVMAAAKRLEGRDDAAAWVRRLREAALRDEDGAALDGALKTIESFL